MQAVNTPQNPRFYDLDILLDMVGSWTLTLEIDGPLGKSSMHVPMHVAEPEGLDLLYPLAGTVAILTLAVWLWDRISARRKRRGAQE